MKIILLADEHIRLEPAASALTIEALSPEQPFSPFHMLAGALATCTHSVLYSWASHAKLDAGDLALEVRWSFAEEPHRVGEMRVAIEWPSLPANRASAARRVAEMCPIHHTLLHATPVEMTVTGGATPPRPSGTRPAAAPRAVHAR